jgi:hypothetical protein
VAIRKSSSSGIPFGNTANRPANPQIGQPYFNGEESRLELYTSATGWQNIVQETPAVVNVVGQLNETTSSTIQINGTNFATGATAFVVGTNGVETSATTTTIVSVVEITAVFPGVSPAYAPYDVKVVNPSNLYGVLYETLGVNDAPVWSTAAGSLGTFTELQAVSVTVAATDATDSTNSPLSYSVVSGALPNGLSLNSSTGVISGTASNVIPNTTYSFTIAATDGRNTAVTRAFSITIIDRSPSWSTGTTLPTFTRNVAYSTTVVATDDDSIASYVVQSGFLPTGLSLNSSTGIISGTPTSSTTATFTIRATDAGGNYVDRAFTMPNVGPVWSTTSGALTSGQTSQAYSTTVVATDDSGNTPGYSLVSGSLPTGITLNTSSGLISGTSNSSGLYTFTVRATDANGNTSDRSFSISINPTVEYLIIAGGGSGGNGASNGSNTSGGGGAGGLLSGTTTLAAGSSYPIVVGAGGSSYTATDSGNGFQGSNSSFNSLISIGGGFGGAAGGGTNGGNTCGGSGGSGGGDGASDCGGAGTPGQGNNGGTGGGSFGSGGGGYVSAGGGGSASSGGSGTSAFSVWASATGTGGGFGATAGGSSGSSSSNAAATSGSGSGAGGTAGTITTGAGGSGVVIIRYAGSQTASGGSVSSSGGYTYHTFTSNGTYIA